MRSCGSRWPAVSAAVSKSHGRPAPRSLSESSRSSLLSTRGDAAFPVLLARTSSTLRAARAHRGTPVAVRRGWRRGARVGCGSPMAGEERPDDRLAEASGDVRHTLRGLCRVPVCRCGRRVRESRDPYLAAILASAMAFFGARAAFVAGELDWMIGAIPVIEGAVLALMLRSLLSLEPQGQRDLGRLALVAGAALAFVTVAIPLQLKQQWITIGWALEGAALAWVYTRIPHRGLFYSGIALLGAVFVRLALNPEVLDVRATRLAADFQLVSLRLRPLRGSACSSPAGSCRRRTIACRKVRASRRSFRAPASSCCSCCSISKSQTSTLQDRRSCSGSAPPSRRI